MDNIDDSLSIEQLDPTLAPSRFHVIPAMKDGTTVKLSVGQILDILLDAAPATLDTLNELAAALGDDPDFAATVTASLAARLEKAQNLNDVADKAAAAASLSALRYAAQTLTEQQQAQSAANISALRFAAQTLTEAQRGQARVNIGAGLLTRRRNKLINGNFDIWQRGSSFTGAGLTADRWSLASWGTGGAGTVAAAKNNAFTFPHGTRNVLLWSRTTAASTAARITQKIEGAQTLAGRTVTIAFRAYNASSPATISTRADVNFGTGGAPSAEVSGVSKAQLVGTDPNGPIYYHAFTMPDVSGKTFGSNNDDYVAINIDSPGSGTFDIRLLQLAFVEGDATGDPNVFDPWDPATALRECQRYTQDVVPNVYTTATVASEYLLTQFALPVPMRATPSSAVINPGTVVNCSPVLDVLAPSGFRYGLTATNAGVAYVANRIVRLDAEL